MKTLSIAACKLSCTVLLALASGGASSTSGGADGSGSASLQANVQPGACAKPAVCTPDCRDPLSKALGACSMGGTCCLPNARTLCEGSSGQVGYCADGVCGSPSEIIGTCKSENRLCCRLSAASLSSKGESLLAEVAASPVFAVISGAASIAGTIFAIRRRRRRVAICVVVGSAIGALLGTNLGSSGIGMLLGALLGAALGALEHNTEAL